MRDMVIGNGNLTVGFDQEGRMREVFTPMPGLWNQTLGAPSLIGLQVKGVTTWLGGEQKFGCLQFDDRRSRLSWNAGKTGIQLRVDDEVHETSALLQRHFQIQGEPGKKLRVLLHHDFRLLETEYQDGVRFVPKRGFLLHHKREQNIAIGVYPGTKAEQLRWTLGRRDSYGGKGIRESVAMKEPDQNPCAVGAGESILGIDLVCDERGRASFTSFLASWRSTTEEAEIESLLSQGPKEPFLPPEEETPTPRIQQLIDQSRLVLNVYSKTVIASPDTATLNEAREHYGYVWPRDGAFVAMTWDRIGNRQAARQFYDFCSRALTEEGYLHQRYNPDGTVGSSWHPEPEEGSPLRPIQEDSIALCCLAAARHAEQEVDAAAKATLITSFILPAARFLTRFIDQESGLPLPSHDLWEERFGIHTFTVTSVIAALKAVSHLVPESSEDFLPVARRMQDAMKTRLFHNDAGRYARMATVLENGDLHLDATPDSSLCGLFLFDESQREDELVQRTIASIERELWVANGIGGMARYRDDHYHSRCSDPDWIPGNPWLICTLWLAHWHALKKTEEGNAKAEKLLNWVVKYARPAGALPEQIHPLSGENVSVCPLVWSHSTLVDTAIAMGLA